MAYNELDLADVIKMSAAGVPISGVELQPATSLENLDPKLVKELFNVLGIKEDFVLQDVLNIQLEALRKRQTDCNCDNEEELRPIRKLNQFLKKEFQKILDAIPPIEDITEDDIDRLYAEIIRFLDTVLKTDLHLKNEEQIKKTIYTILQLLVKTKDIIQRSAIVNILKTLQYLNNTVLGGQLSIIISNLISIVTIDIRLLIMFLQILQSGFGIVSKLVSVILGLFPPNLATLLSVVQLLANIIFFVFGLVQNIGTAISYAFQIVRSLIEIGGALIWLAQNVTLLELLSIAKQLLSAVLFDPFVEKFMDILEKSLKFLQKEFPIYNLV